MNLRVKFDSDFKKGMIVTVGFSVLQKIRSQKRVKKFLRRKFYNWVSFLFTGVVVKCTSSLLILKCFSGIEGFTLRFLLAANNIHFIKKWNYYKKRAVIFNESSYKKILKRLDLR